MAQSETARLLTPLSAAIAAALAVAVWFLPLPGDTRPAEVIRVGPGTPQQGASIQAVGPTPNHNWRELAELLGRLRDPIEVRPDDPPPPVIQPAPPPTYRYLGMISRADGQAAALLDLGNNRQRFVTVGDVIPDPDRDDVVVREITAEQVILQRGEVTSTLTRNRNATPRPGSTPPDRPMPPPEMEDQLLGQDQIR